MKTLHKTLTAIGLVFLMSFFLSGCAQDHSAGNMDETMTGRATEMTGQNMDKTMDTLGKETMKDGMADRNMEGAMDTMKDDTMQGDMQDQKMKDSEMNMMK